MDILIPHIACVVTAGFKGESPTPLERALAEGYQQIYIQTSNGVLLHRVLRPGKDGAHRFLRTPVVTIPGKVANDISAGMNFLPAGKIPVTLFDQVKAFFRAVIEKKGQKLEAMIWILWNQELGYHLHVPNQTVGGASARYEWDSVPPDSLIVVDIHSHADFNAFFSSTDNNDDRNSIRFSAVVGHNAPGQERTYKARFNYQGVYQEVGLDTIFAEPERPEVTVPDAWLEKVSLHAPTIHYPGSISGYNGSTYQTWMANRANGGGGRMDGTNRQFSGFPHTQGMTTGSVRGDAGVTDLDESDSLRKNGGHRTVSKKPESSFGQTTGLQNGQGAGVVGNLEGMTGDIQSQFFSETMKRLSVGQEVMYGGRTYRRTETSMVLVPEMPKLSLEAARNFPLDAEERIHRAGNRGLSQAQLELEELQQGMPPGGSRIQTQTARTSQTVQTSQEEEMQAQADAYFDNLQEEAGRRAGFRSVQRIVNQCASLDGTSGAETETDQESEVVSVRREFLSETEDNPLVDFDTIAINHGVSKARALQAIDLAGVELIGDNNLLGRATGDLFDLIDDDKKLKVFREMAEKLPEKALESLQTNGL